MPDSLVIRRGGELDGLLEELRHAILDLVLRHELSTPPSCQFRAQRPGAHIPTHKRIDAMDTDLGIIEGGGPDTGEGGHWLDDNGGYG